MIPAHDVPNYKVPNTSLKEDQDKTCIYLCWFKFRFRFVLSAAIAKLKVQRSVITLSKKAKLWNLWTQQATKAFQVSESRGGFRFLMLWPRPLLHHRARASVAFIRLFWLRPFSTPLCLILDFATYTCEPSLIQDTEVVVFHYIFSWPARKALKRRLLRPVSHGSHYIHTGAKRHRFAFNLSSMMAAQDFNFLLATDSYKVRITWLPSFDNRNTKARDST